MTARTPKTLVFAPRSPAVGVPAYHSAMTAAFDATHGTDQRFTDALSGSDGMADPSTMMPVLDVYPDALSASMPVDVVPVDGLPVVLPPLAQPNQQPGVRAEPVSAAAAGQPMGRRPAAARGPQRPAATRSPQRRPAPAWEVFQPAQRPVAPRPAAARPTAPRPPAPLPPAAAYRRPQASPAATSSLQGRTVTAADVADMFRNVRPGRPMQVDRQSFQATHPQSVASASPAAVAPAAPMASQYTARGQVRNTSRDRAQERRRVSSSVRRRGSSVWAVIVFMFVILFATGLGQKAIDLITGLLNR